jgi:hypothetical protein
MKWCTRLRIDEIMPNGVVTEAKLLDISRVPDDHPFGLFQEDGGIDIPEATARGIRVLSPVVHLERPDPVSPGSERHPAA